MEDWMDYKSFSDKISRIVRPQSYQLGIKLFKGKDIPPKEAVRPSKYGIKNSLCQWTTMARRWGRILAAEMVDISCTPCLAALCMKKYVYHTGELIESQTTGFGISCLSAIKPYFTGKSAFVHPGRGERILAGTDEAEMFFTFPATN